MSVTINGTSGVTTPGIANSEGYTGDGLTIAAGAPAGALQINSAGNAGLGVTPSVWGSTSKAIQFGAFGSISGSAGNFAGIATNRYNDGANKYIGTGLAALYEQGNGVHAWYIAPSGTAGNPITFTQAMTLDASGNLLVGTTSNPAITSGPVSRIVAYATTSNGVGLSAQYGGSYTGQLYRADTITTSGTGWYYFMGLSGNGSAVTTTQIQIFGNGNIQNSNNSYGAISDAKLKENIVDASPKLDKVTRVRVVNYNLTGDYEQHKQIGVIAQELEQVFPSLVEEIPDCDVEGNDLGTTTKSVKYSVFVPILIKAIQEQQAMITELKARIEQLEAK